MTYTRLYTAAAGGTSIVTAQIRGVLLSVQWAARFAGTSNASNPIAQLRQGTLPVESNDTAIPVISEISGYLGLDSAVPGQIVVWTSINLWLPVRINFGQLGQVSLGVACNPGTFLVACILGVEP